MKKILLILCLIAVPVFGQAPAVTLRVSSFGGTSLSNKIDAAQTGCSTMNPCIIVIDYVYPKFPGEILPAVCTGCTWIDNRTTINFLILNNASNAYTTGIQDFTGATSVLVSTQSAGDSSTKAASTSFVTTAVSNAIAAVNPAMAVQAATNAILPNSPTFTHVDAGIGSFITTLTLNTALVVDGYTPVLNDRILVKNESGGLGASRNGVYTVTQVSGVGLAWILVRALDYDQPSDMNNTGAIPVVNGTANAATQWVLTSSVATVDTDALTFTQFSVNPATIATSATSPITLSGNTVACATCTTAASSLTSNGVVTGAGGQAEQITNLTYSASALGLPAGGTISSADTGAPGFSFSSNLITATRGLTFTTGNITLPAGGTLSSVDTGTPTFTWAANAISVNQPFTVTGSSELDLPTERADLSCASGSAYRIWPSTGHLMKMCFNASATAITIHGSTNTSTTTTNVPHATATAGVTTLSDVLDSELSTSDITTNNASTSKHGFLKKLDNVATDYMDGTGNWSVPAGSGGGVTISTAGVGNLYMPAVFIPMGSSTAGTVEASANDIHLYQFVLPFTITINKLNLVASATQNVTADVGVYQQTNANAANCTSSNCQLMLHVNNGFNFNTAGAQTQTASTTGGGTGATLTLAPGVYYLATCVNGTTGTFSSIAQGFGSTINKNQVRQGTITTGCTTGVLPSSIGTITATTFATAPVIVGEP